MTYENQHRAKRLSFLKHRLFLIGLIIALTAALWRFSPLQEYLEPEYLVKFVRIIRNSPYALPAIILAYITASVLVLPNTAINVAVVIGIGGWHGFTSALFGSIVAALLLYGLGRKYGTKRFKKIKSNHIKKMQDYLKEGGIISVVIVRQLPIAPFPVINVMAGAMKVRFIPFLLGTFIGLLPGITLVSVFGRQLRKIIENPQPTDYILLALLIFLVVGAMLYLKKKVSHAKSNE